MTRPLLTLLALMLMSACAHAGSLPSDNELSDEIRVVFEEPEALAEGHALLMTSRHGVALEIGVVSNALRRWPDLAEGTVADEVEWELVSGGGRINPSADNPFHCRYLPLGITAEEPVIVRATLTRTHSVDPGAFRRTRHIRATVQAEAQIIAPVSGDTLDETGRIQGFEVGIYPSPYDEALLTELGPGYNWVRENAARFELPSVFYPVTRTSKPWRLSEHVILGELVLDRPWFREMGMPQWITLDPLLVSKLEELADLMHENGHDFDQWTMIYGFRPPAYNLGRRERDAGETLKSPFSQHMYGRAVDIIIDQDGDLIIDDLNGDGENDIFDAAVIAHYVNLLDRQYRATNDPRVGGAGLYDHHDFFERPVQTPYTHVDVRGFLHANGTLYRWLELWPGSEDIRVRWGAPTLNELIWRETPPPAPPTTQVTTQPNLPSAPATSTPPTGYVDPMMAVQQGRERERAQQQQDQNWRMINPGE